MVNAYMISERCMGLTQEALVKILNTTKHAISKYECEQAEPPDTMKILIAKHFHVSVDYLLGLTDTLALLHQTASAAARKIFL